MPAVLLGAQVVLVAGEHIAVEQSKLQTAVDRVEKGVAQGNH